MLIPPCFFSSRITIGSISLIVHLHTMPCEDCMLTSNEDNRLCLSHPPAPERVVAQPRKKIKPSSAKPSSVALPKPTAPQTVEAESKASYVDRAKLRRSHYGSTAPSIAQKETSPPVQQQQIESSGIHAKSMSMITPRAGLGSEKLVDEVERELEWQRWIGGRKLGRRRGIDFRLCEYVVCPLHWLDAIVAHCVSDGSDIKHLILQAISLPYCRKATVFSFTCIAIRHCIRYSELQAL